MKRQEPGGCGVHVGEAVQVHERLAAADLGHFDLHAADSRAKSAAESRRSAGATSVAKSRMLFRASSGRMLPKWNWMSRLPTPACSIKLHSFSRTVLGLP
jgi:hypothetical protein